MALSFVGITYGTDLQAQEEDSTLGISVGITYWSNYYWRGTPYYSEDGAFFPTISYDVLKTGLVLSVSAELAEDWVFDNKAPQAVKDLNATDFGLDYSYTFADMVSLGAGAWYFHTWGTAGRFISWYLSASAVSIPLSPTLSFSHDYYTDSKEKEDFYVVLGISHTFALYEAVDLTLGASGGYYRAKSVDKNGISDIDLSAALSVTKGIITYSADFHYLIIPSKDYYDFAASGAKDINRFYSSFGISLSF